MRLWGFLSVCAEIRFEAAIYKLSAVDFNIVKLCLAMWRLSYLLFSLSFQVEMHQQQQ